MKNINLKKKNSFVKIIGMKINDYKAEIIFIFLAILALIFIGFPLFFKSISNWFSAINAAVIAVIIFIGIPMFDLTIGIISSIKGIQYIPLTEEEIENEGLKTVNEYAKYINNLITYKSYIFENFRIKVPEKISDQVIEFGIKFYSLDFPEIKIIKHHNFNDYLIIEKRLCYEPYSDLSCFEHKINKKCFFVKTNQKKLTKKEFQDYIKNNPEISEKLNLKDLLKK